MQCREAREFFSPYLDGELPEEHIEVLQRHLEGCANCREELARWQELSRTLREMQAPVTAPPGFAAAVMARVTGADGAAAAAGRAKAAGSGGRAAVRTRYGARRWIAAAAAALLAAGSIGYAARGLWQYLPSPVALVQPQDGQQAGGDNGTGGPGTGVQQPGVEPPGVNLPPGPGLPPGDGNNTLPQGEDHQPSTEAGDRTPGVTPPDNGGENNNTPGNGRPQAPGNDQPGQEPVQMAGGETYTPRAFLNSERVAVNTLLKVKVADMAAARAGVADLAGSNGATARVVGEQNDGLGEQVVYELVVAGDRAAGLLAGLKGLGQAGEPESSASDLTAKFNSTLEQYRAKVAQVNATEDPAEKEKLLQEAKALEQQLATWEQETQQQTIILWLETE